MHHLKIMNYFKDNKIYEWVQQSDAGETAA